MVKWNKSNIYVDPHENKRLHEVNHMQTHTGERQYSCKVCGFSFAQKIILHQHIQAHTG